MHRWWYGPQIYTTLLPVGLPGEHSYLYFRRNRAHLLFRESTVLHFIFAAKGRAARTQDRGWPTLLGQ